METKIYNDDNLIDNDVNRVVIRAKSLIFNSSDEILLGYSHDIYQFIGGHIEENEDIIAGLKREILEETGINIDEEMFPFFKMVKYVKDYPKGGDNSRYEYYYYYIRTDKKPNLEHVSYTDDEKEGHFKLIYVPFAKVQELFEDNRKVSEVIALENIEAIEKVKKYIK